MYKPIRTLVHVAVMSVLAIGSEAQAAGFSLYGEGAGYAVGNYAAGAAAEAADASTGWYNPAGLALIREQQVVAGGIGIFPVIQLDGSSTFSTTTGLPPPFPSAVEYVQDFEGLSGASNAFVPSFHYARPLGERTTFGFSVTAPFGLATNWAPDSPVRYAATFTEVLTANFSPELGTRLTENFAVGAGLDLQWSRVKFNQIIGAPTLFQILDEDPTLVDTLSYNKGKSWGVGFHVGVMGIFNDNHTRIGINYQSRVRHVFYGHSRLSGVLANTDFNLAFPVLPPEASRTNWDLFSNPQEFPDVLTFSAYQDINPRLALLASVIYTGWGVFKEIQLNNIAAPNIGGPPFFNVTGVNINNNVPQNFHDVWRYALGANYHLNQKFMLRVGGGYDQSPTNNTDRTVRLPDGNRWVIAVGGHYQWKPNIGVDLGYTHMFVANDPSVHTTQVLSETSSFSVDSDSGKFGVDLVGAQLTWIIDPIPVATTK
jgi:long-chain fatty acid transport protein